MTEVETPDGVVEFPDSMSQDEIRDVLRKKYPKQTTAEPKIALSPYEQLRMQGVGPGLSPYGPPNPEAVLALPELAKGVGKALNYPLEQLSGLGGDLLVDFLNRSGLDPSAQTGEPIGGKTPSLPIATIPGTGISPLDIISPEVRKGIESGAGKLLEGIRTPEMVSTLPFAGLKPVQAIYGASAAGAVPDSIQAILDAKSPREASEAATSAAANLLIAHQLGKGLSDAQTIRGDTGQLRETGLQREPSQGNRGPNVEQIAPRQPEPVDTGEKETPQKAEVKPQDLRPAVQIGDKVVLGEVGDKHADILTKAGVDPESIPHEDERRGFADVNNPDVLIPRKPSEKIAGVEGTADAGGLDSRDLPKVQESAESTQLGGGAAEAGEIPDTGVGGEKYGVAERVRAERAKAGQVGEVEPGEGINTPESINRGRAILQSDTDAAERLMTKFESDKKLSSDGMAVARAHGEALAGKARRTEEQFGTDSPEYRAARDELTAWDKRSKAMQTEWHKTGMAQQGETDIDTGSYSGLERAFNERTGRDFTPDQGKGARKVSKRVKGAATAVDEARNNLSATIDHEFPKPPRTTDAEKAALDAASKTVRENAIRLAEEENKARVAKTVRDKAIADEQVNAAKKALEASQKVARENAIRLAKAENEAPVNPERAVWDNIKRQMDRGETDLHKMRGKAAVELGLSRDKVTQLMGKTARVKRVADDLILKQQTLRRAHDAAKRWLMNLEVPTWEKIVSRIPTALFKLKVGAHGLVAPGTHAPMLLFKPQEWGSLFRNSAKMYKMVGLPTIGGQKAARVFYENQMADLVKDKNWGVARRNGLINDPYQYEDFTSPDTAKFYGDLTGMGNRGYSMLKLLRQDIFNRTWDEYPRFMQTDAMAKGLSDQINHITGVTQKPPFQGSHYLLFAPRLLLSRAAWLGADPVRALRTILNWKDAGIEDKEFARREITGKLTVAGTMFGMLAANQALLSLFGSKQKVNMTNPNESDFLHFKALGMDASFGSPMINMARLPARLVAIGMGPQGKMSKIVYPDDELWQEAGRFIGGQASPAAQLAIQTLITREDPTGRQLPHSNRPMPKRLTERGIQPYTWPEYLAQQLSPIPVQEMMKDVWGKQFGQTDEQIKAWATLLFMTGTGGRMREDLTKKQTRPELP